MNEENEDMTAPCMIEVYCSYEGENSPRHLEGSRLNWTLRREGNGWKKERKREERREGGYEARGEPGDQEDIDQDTA